jgi:NAD(P)-dependent dehydrogenase (short-subunit alcohol dehydrogenase family)
MATHEKVAFMTGAHRGLGLATARVAALLEQRCGRLDSLVKNAGLEREGAVFGAPDGGNDTSTVSEAALRATFETNVFAVMALTQTLWPLLRRAPAGRIVTLSSLLGSLTLHADPTSPIDTTKACAFDASQTARNAFMSHVQGGVVDRSKFCPAAAP